MTKIHSFDLENGIVILVDNLIIIIWYELVTWVSVENVAIKLAVLKKPYFYLEFMSLALLEFNLPNCLAEMAKFN